MKEVVDYVATSHGNSERRARRLTRQHLSTHRKPSVSLRQVEDPLFEQGIDISHEPVRFSWNRFGPIFADEIRKRRVHHRSYSKWRWHLDEVFLRINGDTYYL